MSRQFAPDVQQRIRDQMAQGNYQSEDDLLRDALDALADRNADLAAIRAGVADMEAGRMRSLSDVANDIRKKHGWASDA
jgi:predicted transcriptional regulator